MDFLIEVFLKFSQLAVYFEKSPSQMKIDEEHLFEEQLVGCSSQTNNNKYFLSLCIIQICDTSFATQNVS